MLVIPLQKVPDTFSHVQFLQLSEQDLNGVQLAYLVCNCPIPNFQFKTTTFYLIKYSPAKNSIPTDEYLLSPSYFFTMFVANVRPNYIPQFKKSRPIQ